MDVGKKFKSLFLRTLVIGLHRQRIASLNLYFVFPFHKMEPKLINSTLRVSTNFPMMIGTALWGCGSKKYTVTYR